MTQQVFKKGQVWLYDVGLFRFEKAEILAFKYDFIQYILRHKRSVDSEKKWAKSSDFNKNAKQLIKDVE